MSIKIDLYDNTSSVRIKPHSESTPVKIGLCDNASSVIVKPSCDDNVKVESGCNIDKKRLEALLDEEIQNRITGDTALSNRIDDLTVNDTRYIYIEELDDGQINVSLLNDQEEIIDTKTITLTKKIIKNAVLDYEHSKIIYTCKDDSIIELNISDIVDKITSIISELASINQEISILDGRLDDAEITIDDLVTTTIPSIQEDLSEIDAHIDLIDEDLVDIHASIDGIDDNITDINASITDIENDLDGINTQLETIDEHLITLDENMAQAELSIIELQENKIDKDLLNSKDEHGAALYPYVAPKDLDIEDVRKLLLYTQANGIPSKVKLDELGFNRVRNADDFNKVDTGDLLIDME